MYCIVLSIRLFSREEWIYGDRVLETYRLEDTKYLHLWKYDVVHGS
jgi:hypothetical protein